MIQKHRIATNIGKDKKINVEIKQGFDIMEILSLKFSQKDIYASGLCSEYGVVVGRVSANSGFGIPNAKVSIFVPQSELDADDPVISKLYPYTSITDKNEEGYRYNLLPNRQQHPGHAPTGTFPDQEDILTREEILEVFESYYKYTVKTNSAGDFMIWGIPVGVQTIHVDIDLSDIGCFSLRPYDFLKKGYGEDDFERLYSFKSSADIDGLPQIVSFDRSVEVYPLWGNEDLCDIGISRTDFDLTEKGIKIEPISLILVSSVTDDNSDAVKRNGKIRKNTGYKCNLQTTSGKIECVRYTGNKVLGSDGITKYPELEFFNVTEVIDENGVAMAVLPMNMDYVYTNEFGEEEVTNDKNKGIPTTAVARFRFGLDFDSPKVSAAKYLVPNIREFNPTTTGTHSRYEYYEGMIASYQFSDVFEDYITPPHPSNITLNSTGYNSVDKKDLMLGTNYDGIPQETFYKFIFGKVYSVSSFQGTHYETERRDAFLGIKQIRPATEEDCASKTNYIPTNFAFKNRVKFSLLLAQIALFIQYIFSIILVKFAEIIGAFFYAVSTMFYNIGIRKWRPFRRISERFKNAAYNMQDRFTKQLPLTIYPDCEECTSDADTATLDISMINDYCRVAEYMMKVDRYDAIFHPGEKYYSNTCDYVSRPNVCIWGYNIGPTYSFRNTTSDDSFLSDSALDENKIFPGEKAKDDEGACAEAESINFNSGTLNLLTLGAQPNLADNKPRYVAVVYPYVAEFGTVSGATLFGEFAIYIQTGHTDSTTYGAFYEVEQVRSDCMGISNDVWFGLGTAAAAGSSLSMTYDQWNDLSGMDFENLPPGAERYTNAVIRIYDRSKMKTTGDTTQDITIEEGCDKYDKTYNEDMVLGYLWFSGDTGYGDLTEPSSPSGLPGSNFASYWDAPGFREYDTTYTETNRPPYPWGTNLMSTLIGGTNTQRLPLRVNYKKIADATYDRKTKSGLSEFRDGVFTIIPVIRGKSYNLIAIQEWYRRKRVGLGFCGGVANYSFIDNWLTGLLYFFKFDKRIRWDTEASYDLNVRGTKYPRELVFYHVFDKIFYYRSCPYYSGSFVGQSWTHLNNSGSPVTIKEILHPTTFYDVGVRDEFLNEICNDPRVDPYCSVVRDITNTSYQDPGNVMEYAINYRLDINAGKFDVDDFFTRDQLGSTIKVMDGDVTQLMSINCEAGIEAFDLDTPHYYMYNGEMMDPENTSFSSYFKGGTATFGPTPIDLKFDNNGAYIRSCLNYRLGDYSQIVPFYLWDKGGTGFGPYNNDTSDQQSWDKSEIASMKLQRLFSISGITDTISNYVMRNNEEEYLLKPMTINHSDFWFYGPFEDALERFEAISWNSPSPSPYPGDAQDMGYIEGDLWLQVIAGSLSDPQAGYLYAVVNSTWTQQTNNAIMKYFDNSYETFIPQTIINYWGNKQVLSTPFLFYFGLKPEKTAIDILIKYFGPKGVFTISGDTICPVFDVVTPTPSPTPAASLLPTPVPPETGVWVTPTPTPTPTPSGGGMFPPFFSLNVDNMWWDWDDVGDFYAKEAEISTNEDWALDYEDGELPVELGRLGYVEFTEDSVLKRMPIGCGPDWLEMQVYLGGTWQTASCNTPYPPSNFRIRFYVNSQNYPGSSDRTATIYFSDGVTRWTGPYTNIIMTQAYYNPPTPLSCSVEISCVYDVAPSLGDPCTGFTIGSTSFDFGIFNPVDGIPFGTDVPWTISFDGGTKATGTIYNMKENQQYYIAGTLSSAPSAGDLIYIYICNIV